MFAVQVDGEVDIFLAWHEIFEIQKDSNQEMFRSKNVQKRPKTSLQLCNLSCSICDGGGGRMALRIPTSEIV